MSRCPGKSEPMTSHTPKIDCSKVRKSGVMTTRLPDAGLFACPMTQTRHGVCYLSRKPGRYPSESNKILISCLTRRVLELTQQPPARCLSGRTVHIRTGRCQNSARCTWDSRVSHAACASIRFNLPFEACSQASDSNSIPHGLFESSGMQTFSYPANGYPYNPIKPEI